MEILNFPMICVLKFQGDLVIIKLLAFPKSNECVTKMFCFFFSYLAELSLFCTFQASFQRDRKTGLSTVKFNIEKRTSLNINDATCVILNVKLDCNVEETPWCDNPDS